MTTVVDINHPRQLLIQWRDEAASLDAAAAQHPELMPAVQILRGQATLLRHCADQLESRLLWSGLS